MVKKKKAARRKKPPAKRKPAARKTRSRRGAAARGKARGKKKARRSTDIELLHVAATGRRGLGAGSAGQSGDTQGLSRTVGADSESVEELVEEGQDFEAGVVAGVEEADDDEGEVRTKQVLEDDVPLEYLDKD